MKIKNKKLLFVKEMRDSISVDMSKAKRMSNNEFERLAASTKSKQMKKKAA